MFTMLFKVFVIFFLMSFFHNMTLKDQINPVKPVFFKVSSCHVGGAYRKG